LKLERFKISKLFGFRDVTIPFDSNIKILVGENGLGKTTILNCLYYLLATKYNKLALVDFERIELAFFDGTKFRFTKRELENYLGRKSRFRRISGRRRRALETIDFSEIIDKLQNSDSPASSENALKRWLINHNISPWAPPQIMLRDILSYFDDNLLIKFREFNSYLESLDYEILYFPTYRRVEVDLKNLGRFKRKVFDPDFGEEFVEEITEDFDISEDTLIHFGMEDVKKRIKNVKETVINSTVEGYSKVSGQILSQLLKGFDKIDMGGLDVIDLNTVEIVLHRVGNNLPEKDKREILKLFKNPDKLLMNRELTYFLINLTEIYNQHKHVDDAIKKFRDVCNRYLSDKEIKYIESTVDIYISRKNFKNNEKSDNNEDRVSWDKLSSGEKQIISIFSKIFLEPKGNYVILFDEPELSLSIEWQKQLLPDMFYSEKVSFLLAVTHSPFIFKNELEFEAYSMSSYLN